MITVIAIGNKHEDWVQIGVERYQKRLRKPFDVRWELLPHSSLHGQAARQEESKRILAKLPSDATVVLLDERGEEWTSEALSSKLQQQFNQNIPIYYVIGGAFGVDSALRQRADIEWSLSKLVFPHQLVRLVITEQIYRAQEIARGGKYHHI